ncbi:MAG: VOC family protein [Nitrospinae bacterium]|nr:VOC family protein [Nitrospinota bacterium]
MIKKYLHTRFRVSDLDRSIDFYSKILGLKLAESLRGQLARPGLPPTIPRTRRKPGTLSPASRWIERKTSPRGSQLAFLQAPGTDSEIELRAFPSSGKVEVPEDLVHLAFEVDDLKKCMADLKKAGYPITDGPTTTSGGTTFIFTEDPDRYEIELMQCPS